MLQYVLLFIGFGLTGWAVDTSYRTYKEGHYSPNTLVPYFSVIYGLGGLLLLLLFKHTQLPVIADVVLGGMLATILEFIGGWFCKHILKRKLWDYSRKPYNYYGYIDAQHATYWIVLTAILRILFPYLPI